MKAKFTPSGAGTRARTLQIDAPSKRRNRIVLTQSNFDWLNQAKTKAAGIRNRGVKSVGVASHWATPNPKEAQTITMKEAPMNFAKDFISYTTFEVWHGGVKGVQSEAN